MHKGRPGGGLGRPTFASHVITAAGASFIEGLATDELAATTPSPSNQHTNSAGAATDTVITITIITPIITTTISSITAMTSTSRTTMVRDTNALKCKSVVNNCTFSRKSAIPRFSEFLFGRIA